ncbi:MAG: ABC transporter ATP-binding protein [Planctomycetota bacterium]
MQPGAHHPPIPSSAPPETGSPPVVIRATDLTKRYRLGASTPAGQTLGELIYTGIGAACQRLRQAISPSPEPVENTPLEADPARVRRSHFLALDRISFDVPRGQVLGVIGRNGAGKSTLLKLLSRITDPTTGEVMLRGRVGSLLEVGTGFHPELSGRENIYLNGAVLGMTRREVRDKFDAIVAFAEIDKFLDTPVKRYSSGMFVRLAFAVAAHLEPEILLIDEVLAVGDAGFQRKCLGKMHGIAEGGRTVVFVSHDMGAIQQLCDRVMVLEGGRIDTIDEPRVAVARYLELTADWRDEPASVFRGPLTDRLRFDGLWINDQDSSEPAVIHPDQPIDLRVSGHADEAIPAYRTTFSVFRDGIRLLTQHDAPHPTDLPAGPFTASVQLPPNLLRPGGYTVCIGGYREGMQDYTWGVDLARFTVAEAWSEQFDPVNLGLVNLPGHGSRNHHAIAPATEPVAA